MSELLRSRCLVSLLVIACGTLTACGSIPDKIKVTDAIKPYQIDRVQGNVVTREQYAALRVGMPRRTVQEILGTPLLTSVFHADRWDYVFSLTRQGSEPQMRRASVYFKGDTLQRFEADELPSEAEFVSTLKSMGTIEKLPALQATPESLQNFPPPAKSQDSNPSLPAVPAASYPPLEPASR